ncbi:MAG: glycosyltransferase [Luteolibacter sp.]
MKRPKKSSSNIAPAAKRMLVRLARRMFRVKTSETPAPSNEDWRDILTGGMEKQCPAAVFRKLSEESRISGDLAEADRICSRGVEIHPTNLWLALIHAQIANSLDDPQTRLSRWQRVIELGGNKSPAKAFKNVADYYLEEGDFDKAGDLVYRGMELHPDDYFLAERLGKISLAAGLHSLGIEQSLELIKRFPDQHSPAVYQRISRAYCAEGLFRRAETVLSEAILRFPDDRGLREALACLRPVPPSVRREGESFISHLFRDRVEPFGKGRVSLPLKPGSKQLAIATMLDFGGCVAPLGDREQAEEVDVFTGFNGKEHRGQNLGRQLAAERGKPFLHIDCGFLRSPTTGDGGCAQSIIISPDTPYYDTTRPSFLENRLNSEDFHLTDEQTKRAADCAAEIVRHRVSRRADLPFSDPRGTLPARNRKSVLLIDEPLADETVAAGLGGMLSFERMWETALAMTDHDIFIRLHPDSFSATSYLGRTLPETPPPHVTFIDFDVNPFRLFEMVDEVFVCTSRWGFEALLAGKEVHCFAVPFYAGWGLTIDHGVVPRRKRRRSLEEIFHVVYLEHSRYFVPDRGLVEIEDMIRHLVETHSEGIESPTPATPSMPVTSPVPDAPLRILIILPSARKGASGRYIQNLAWSLCRLGCEVMVLAEGKCPTMENGVRWCTLAFEGLRLAEPVRDRVTLFKPDIVYESGVRTRAQRAALEIMVLTGARLAMQSEDDDVQVYETHHGTAAAEILTLIDKPQLTVDDITHYLAAINLNHSINVLLDPRHDRWVEPITRALCYRLASLHTAIWLPFEARLAKEYERPTLVVPPVASVADFERLPFTADDRAEILGRMGIDAFRVVYFIGGSLYSYSDEYAAFLDALNQVAAKSGCPIALVVTPARSSLPIARMAREQLLPEIAFADVDLANDNDYMGMLKACDVVCSPGLPDTFNRFRLPSRLVKAMAMAKPVLTCRHGFGESLDHGVNAFLMEGTDPAEWADSIELSLDAERRLEIGNAGQDFARLHFDSDRVAQQLKSEFVALMARPARCLSNGIALSRSRSKSAGLSALRSGPGLNLRGRYHSSMQDAILAISVDSSRFDTVVHLGAGHCDEFENYCRLGASSVLLVEALAEPVSRLRKLTNINGTISVIQAVIAGEPGTDTAFIVHNVREDSAAPEQLWLSQPRRMMERMPAFRIARECAVTTTTIASVCEGINLSGTHNLLVLELNGAEAAALAATPSDLLRRFRWIALRVCDPPLCEGGTTRDAIVRILLGAGQESVPTAPNHAEPGELLLFRAASARETPVPN